MEILKSRHFKILSFELGAKIQSSPISKIGAKIQIQIQIQIQNSKVKIQNSKVKSQKSKRVFSFSKGARLKGLDLQDNFEFLVFYSVRKLSTGLATADLIV